MEFCDDEMQKFNLDNNAGDKIEYKINLFFIQDLYKTLLDNDPHKRCFQFTQFKP